MAIETRVAGVTVTEAVTLIAPDAARIVVLPAARAVTTPLLLMLATDGVLGIQLTKRLMSSLRPSLQTPIALNCCCWPATIDELLGVTARDTNSALL